MTRILLAAATLFVATTAFADPTVQERYERVWHKAIPNDLDLDKPKLGCICRDSAQLGVIRRTSTPFPGAVCAVPTFNPDGSLKPLAAAPTSRSFRNSPARKSGERGAFPESIEPPRFRPTNR